MQFFFLSELGHGYRYEVGTNGNRVAALASLEASLKRAILDLKNLLAMKGSGQSIAASSSPSESAKIYPHSVITSREEDALQQHGVYSGGKWYVHTDKIYENSSGVEVRRREIASQPFHGPVHETADRSAKNVIPRFATVVPEVKPANIGKVAALKALHEAQQAKAKSGSLDPKSAKAPEVIGGNVKNLIKFHQLQQANVNTAQFDLKIAEARAEVARLRNWLLLQGARLKPDGSFDWGSHVIEYDNADKQNLTMIVFHGGRLYTDNAHTTPLDTSKMSTFFSGPGYAIYVMGKGGSIHVDAHAVGHRHHSSLLAGAKVAGAGELKVVDGWLRFLSNKSGHYQPSVLHLLQVLHILQKNQVQMNFPLLVMPQSARYDNVGQFLTERQLAGRPDYELIKLLEWAGYLDNATLGLKGWRWRISPEKEGVYEISTGNMVAHKDVRQWLKARFPRPDDKIQLGFGR